MRPPLAELETAEEVSRRARELYEGELPTGAGVVHVAAVWRQPGGELRVLKINQATPESATDLFVLNLCRARSDAIVTTGKILRQEPALCHDLAGPGTLPAALADWRRTTAGRSEPPVALVLTSGRGLDLGHPALDAWAQPLIFTSRSAATELERRAAAHDRIEVVGVEAPSLEAALRHLRRRGCATVAIEAGPSTALELYRDPPGVDELLLSVFEGENVPEEAVGPAFLEQERLDAFFGAAAGGAPVTEPSGRWRFFRYLARG